MSFLPLIPDQNGIIMRKNMEKRIITETRKKIFNYISLIINLLIIGFTVYAVSQFFTGTGDGNMAVQKETCFRYFTVDSNILAAIMSAVMLIFNIKKIRNKDAKLPKLVGTLKFMSTVSVTLTMITACFFLSTIYSFQMMISGNCFFLHLITPLIAILACTVFEADGKMSFKAMLSGLIPTVVYGAVYVVMVLILGKENGGWEDFYSFNSGILENKWYLSIVIMLFATFLISLALRAINNGIVKALGKKTERTE